MLEVEWDGLEIVCILGGERIASAPTVSGLIAALDTWAEATGLRRELTPYEEQAIDYSYLQLGELISSRPY